MELDLGAPPGVPWSINEERAHGWRWRQARVKAWRDGMGWVLRDAAARRALSEMVGVPCSVRVELPVRDRRRRDPHNYVPPVKAIIDALVDLGVWPDDTPEWVQVEEPRLVVGATTVRLRLTPITPKTWVPPVCEVR